MLPRSIAVLVSGIALLAAASSATAHEFKAGSLEIGHPWSKATPAGAQVGGGYFVVKNKGSAADRLVSASVERAGTTEIHRMSMKGEVMTMAPVEGGVEIPAGGEVVFEPDGLHLMLMKLSAPLRQGELVPGTLTFERAGTVRVEFKVEPIGSRAPKSADHSHMK